MAARPLWARLSLRIAEMAAAGHADRAVVDATPGQLRLHPPHRLPRRLPARRAPLRHGRVHAIHRRSHGRGRPSANPRLGHPSIEQSISQLTDEIAQRALAAGYVVAPAEQRSKHMLGIRFRGGLPAKLPAALAEAKVYVSIRGDSVRVSPHLYNTSADIDRLFAAIASAYELKSRPAPICWCTRPAARCPPSRPPAASPRLRSSSFCRSSRRRAASS